jgi:hypothetical protein
MPFRVRWIQGMLSRDLSQIFGARLDQRYRASFRHRQSRICAAGFTLIWSAQTLKV